MDIQRVFELERSDGSVAPVLLRVCDLRPEGPDCSVALMIDGAGPLRDARRIFGVDAVQAVLLALRTADIVLRATEEFRTGRLRFSGGTADDPLGLSVAGSSSDPG